MNTIINKLDINSAYDPRINKDVFIIKGFSDGHQIIVLDNHNTLFKVNKNNNRIYINHEYKNFRLWVMEQRAGWIDVDLCEVNPFRVTFFVASEKSALNPSDLNKLNVGGYFKLEVSEDEPDSDFIKSSANNKYSFFDLNKPLYFNLRNFQFLRVKDCKWATNYNKVLNAEKQALKVDAEIKHQQKAREERKKLGCESFLERETIVTPEDIALFESARWSLDDIDRIEPRETLYGFEKGKFKFIAGHKGTGKTFMVMKTACKASMEGHKVLFLVGEYGAANVVERYYKICDDLGWEYDKENFIMEDGNKLGLMLDTTSGQEIFDKLVKHFNPEFVFIDSLSNFSCANENSQHEISKITQFLKNMAFKYDFYGEVSHHLRKRDRMRNQRFSTQDDLQGNTQLLRNFGGVLIVDKWIPDKGHLPDEADRHAEPVIDVYVHEEGSNVEKMTPYRWQIYFDESANAYKEMEIFEPDMSMSVKENVITEIVRQFKAGAKEITTQGINTALNLNNLTGSYTRRIMRGLMGIGKMIQAGATKTVKYLLPENINPNNLTPAYFMA